MAQFTTIQTCGLILDSLYHNSQRASFEQDSLKSIASKCNVSVVTILKVKQILVQKQLLVVEGERRAQHNYWNPSRSIPNPTMLHEVYREFTKDAKSRVKVNQKKRASVSLEAALKTLVKLGYTGVLRRYKQTKGFVKIYEEIDLSKIEMGD